MPWHALVPSQMEDFEDVEDRLWRLRVSTFLDLERFLQATPTGRGMTPVRRYQLQTAETAGAGNLRAAVDYMQQRTLSPGAAQAQAVYFIRLVHAMARELKYRDQQQLSDDLRAAGIKEN